MLQNVHYFDQISNVRYANKVCFLERTKPRKPLKLQELRGFCSKVRYFLLTILRELPGLDPDWPL